MTGILQRADSHPLVSVIIPTYNRAAMVTRAICSVLAQTYAQLECIVVDDASTDETPDAIRAIADPRLVYLRHAENRNASAARNTGIARARGAFLAFLDNDDEWLPTKIEKQIALLESSPTVGMVYCWMDYVYADGALARHYRPKLCGDIFVRVLDRNRIGNSSTLVLRREVVDRVGGFDEALPRGNDSDLIRRIARCYQVDVVPEVLVRVHIGHGDRISCNTKAGLRHQLIAAQAKMRKFKQELIAHPHALANIHRELGNTHAQLGDWDMARHHLREAQRIDSFNPRVYRDLIKLRFREFKYR
jgi:glycosyltransferase involved in cell wall biosynthesis